jgi:hypothetical protein
MIFFCETQSGGHFNKIERGSGRVITVVGEVKHTSPEDKIRNEASITGSLCIVIMWNWVCGGNLHVVTRGCPSPKSWACVSMVYPQSIGNHYKTPDDSRPWLGDNGEAAAGVFAAINLPRCSEMPAELAEVRAERGIEGRAKMLRVFAHVPDDLTGRRLLSVRPPCDGMLLRRCTTSLRRFAVIASASLYLAWNAVCLTSAFCTSSSLILPEASSVISIACQCCLAFDVFAINSPASGKIRAKMAKRGATTNSIKFT